MRLQPLSDRVVIRRLEEKTASGLMIVARAEDIRGGYGEIVAVGPGEKHAKHPSGRRPMSLKAGDVVYLGRHPFYEFEFDGEKFLMAHEDDVAACVVPKDQAA